MATLLERVRGAAERTLELERPLKEAIVERDAAILAAYDEGIPAARIAREAGLSRQRVHEIVKTRSGQEGYRQGYQRPFQRPLVRFVEPDSARPAINKTFTALTICL